MNSFIEYIRSADDLALKDIISGGEYDEKLRECADFVKSKYYQNKVYIRGLIEFSNYCRNNCYYCGIGRANGSLVRYRLTKEDILRCCDSGYELGFRTFVLQSGEDSYFSDAVVCDIVSSIKEKYADCAVTLSIGEKNRDSYKAYFDAGADRYLLRHETADEEHYKSLHPKEMSLENRKRCLYDLKDIGYAVGAGFMTGSPYQTAENLVSDLRFLQELEPDMVGLGPFIPHKSTRFADFDGTDVQLTLRMTALVRILLPKALIPATTATATIDINGREKALRCGANVVMPNLSPMNVREQYSLYENKNFIDSESAEGIKILKKSLQKIGLEVVVGRGDRV